MGSRLSSLTLLPMLAAMFIAAASAAEGATSPSSAEGVEFFESHIRPVFVQYCYECHSASSEELKGGLRLDLPNGALKGGTSGPAVVPGAPEKSLLVHAISYVDDKLEMPPDGKLPDQKIADLEAWVRIGAPMPANNTVAATAGATIAPTTAATKIRAMTLEEGRKFWSFVPPTSQPAPQIEGDTWSSSDVDRFVLAKLKENGLAPSKRADKRTLIRRATYDLIGLPPSPEEVDAFERDDSTDAFEKVIDRLLASPHYGERWGRYWLDVARYADTKGYVFEEERRYGFSYTYRDWVVRALNDDLPYDQFLVQQIAADKLPETKTDKHPLAAMGLLTLGRRFLNNPHDIIDDRIDVVTRGTMALTVSCARCHDHKFDPIPTADYYSLYGVFASSREPKELPLLDLADANSDTPQRREFDAALAKAQADSDGFVARRNAEITANLRSAKQIARYLMAAQEPAKTATTRQYAIRDDGKGVRPMVLQRWRAYLNDAAAKDDPIFRLWRVMAAAPKKGAADRVLPTSALSVIFATSPQPLNSLVCEALASAPVPTSDKETAERYAAVLVRFDRTEPFANPQEESLRLVLRGPDSPVRLSLEETPKLFNDADFASRRALKRKIDELAATHPGSPPRAMALEDTAQPVTPHILKRGNPANVGDEVPRRFLAILSPDNREPFKDGSGRLELAKAIASPDNPLTARVIVNRVWQYHFGAGLVRTPSDFGTRGERPTHPELLDDLAWHFAHDDGWSLKKLHKRLMLSATYQQSSSGDNAEALAKDPENRLLWRMSPRRLDFEAMRDSLLASTGQIDLSMGGRAVDITAEPFGRRRTIYAFIERQNLPGVFRTFDFASPDTTSAQRFSTSVPQQALYFMNGPFVIEQARKLAARADVVAESDPRRRVALLYRDVLQRPPSEEEIELAVRFVQSEEAQPREVAKANGPSAWQYGYGEFDETSGRVKEFHRLPHYTGAAWQGGPALPDGKLGWAMLTAGGGHVGNDLHHAAIRRWVAPRDCTVGVAGSVSHGQSEGDGVRARLVSWREGMLASWIVHKRSADTRVSGISVKQGDTIDFVVDCGASGDYSFDSFAWKITITKEAAPQAAAGDDTGSTWDSAAEFTGPAPKALQPLSAWEKYAQVLLESNEFAFVD